MDCFQQTGINYSGCFLITLLIVEAGKSTCNDVGTHRSESIGTDMRALYHRRKHNTRLIEFS
jgi:hypothetical protein